MSFLKIPFYAALYLSVATVLAEGAALVGVWSKGNLNQDSLFQILAVANDVDLATLQKEQQRANSQDQAVLVSTEEVAQLRHATDLDLTLREIAVEKGLVDIRIINSKFDDQWKEYKQLKDSFDLQLQRIRAGATDQAVSDVKRQLESLKSQQAKSQILKILDDPALGREAARQFVVAVFKRMPIKTRKRIIEEFRDEDTERLHEILRQIRKGEPDVGLFRVTRKELKKFD